MEELDPDFHEWISIKLKQIDRDKASETMITLKETQDEAMSFFLEKVGLELDEFTLTILLNVKIIIEQTMSQAEEWETPREDTTELIAENAFVSGFHFACSLLLDAERERDLT